MKKVKAFISLLAMIRWLPVVAVLLVVAGIVMSLLHRSDVAIAMVIGSLTLAHLAHLSDKEPTRA